MNYKLITLGLTTMILLACHSTEQKDLTITLQGSLTYLQRIALTSNASAHIRLVDQNQEIIAEQILSPAGQVPIHFQLTYAQNQIVKQQHYNIQAEIKESGQVRFTTAEPVALDPNAPPQQPITIRLVLSR